MLLRLVSAILLSLFLLGCAATPETVVNEAPGQPAGEPDLALNLSDETIAPCEEVSPIDSLLERGFSALLDGRHVEAISLFQSYKKLEGSPMAAWEADIAIAYDSMLNQSPFYDPVAARAAFDRLGAAPPEGGPVHETVLMMRDSLAMFATLLDNIAELKSDNAVLAEDLAKREEAIKRLRELTLGQ